MVKFHRGLNSVDAFERVEPVNIHTILEKLKYQFEGVAQALGLTFSFLPSTTSSLVLCDEDALADVISSLVHNAFSVCQKGDRISVGILQDSGQCIIVVQDSGPGIDPNNLDQIFQRDFPRRKVHGFSLNLYQMRCTIESLGGFIWAENHNSQCEQGTLFVVGLPIYAGS